MAKTFTRREALAGAAGLAMAGLAGCGAAAPAGEAEAPAWDGGYLPIGSAVRLSGMPDGFEHVVVARRPAHAGSGEVADYALVQAVLGITSDLSGAGGLYRGELVLADESDIVEVLHVGRVTDEELWAEELLSEGRSGGSVGADALLPLIEARAGRLGEDG